LNIRIIEAIDPNGTTSASKELAVVVLGIGKSVRGVEAGVIGATVRTLEQDTLELEDQLSRVVISDENTHARAGALRKEISSVEKGAETSRKNFTEPLRTLTRSINELFAVFTDRLNSSKNLLDMRIISYDRKLQAEARERAEIERKRIEDETLALAASAPAAAEEIMQAGIDVAAQVSDKVALVEAHGVKTGVKLVESGVLNTPDQLIVWLATRDRHLRDGLPALTEIVEFKKSGLNKLAKWAKENGMLDANNEYAGVKWVELEGVRNY
jgi:hypothetical protein